MSKFLLIVLLVDGAVHAQPLSFRAPVHLPAGAEPINLVIADVNKDSRNDIIVANSGSGNLSVYLGDGKRGFTQAKGSPFPAGQSPNDIATGDFNGDGKGHFSLSGNRNFPVPESPFGIAVGDFNGDHHPGIAICHYSGQGTDPSKNGLSVLLGDGKAHFTLAKGSPFPVGHYPPSLSAADLNHDGITDVALPNYLENTVTVYLGGKSGIKMAVGSPIPVGHHPESVVIGDLDGDGKADIAVADEEDNDVMILFAK